MERSNSAETKGPHNVCDVSAADREAYERKLEQLEAYRQRMRCNLLFGDPNLVGDVINDSYPSVTG